MASTRRTTTPYVHHTIVLPAKRPGGHSVTISALLHPDIIPLLPNPLPYATVPLPNPPFTIKHTPDRGYGMFASRRIRAGTMIYKEHPVFIVPAEPLRTNDVPSKVYNEVARRIPRDKYREMVTMANCHVGESIVEGVARTNAVDLQLRLPSDGPIAGGRHYGGPHLKINRSNHSCGPNAAHKWSFDALALTLFAVRDIAEGEEILMYYAAPLQAREQRQQKLESDYGFTCDCPWCTRPFEDQVKSDAAREFLRTYTATHPSYKKWSNDLCLPDDFVIKSHLAVIPMIVQEGLDAMLPVFYDEIARCYAELGQEDDFRIWAEKAVQLAWFAMPELAAELQEILFNPGAFAKWGARVKAHALAKAKPALELDIDDESMYGLFGPPSPSHDDL